MLKFSLPLVYKLSFKYLKATVRSLCSFSEPIGQFQPNLEGAKHLRVLSILEVRDSAKEKAAEQDQLLLDTGRTSH